MADLIDSWILKRARIMAIDTEELAVLKLVGQTANKMNEIITETNEMGTTVNGFQGVVDAGIAAAGAQTDAAVAEVNAGLAETNAAFDEIVIMNVNPQALADETAARIADKAESAKQTDLNVVNADLQTSKANVSNIIAHNGDGTKDTELISARDTEIALGDRLAGIESGKRLASSFNAKNLVVNGGFTNGVNSWNGFAGTITNPTGLEGLYTVTTAGAESILYQTIPCIVGHKYYVSAKVKRSSVVGCSFKLGDTSSSTFALTANQYTSLVASLVAGTTGGIVLSFKGTTLSEIIYVKEVSYIDLTLLFGVGNEPTQAEMTDILSIFAWFDVSLDLTKTIAIRTRKQANNSLDSYPRWATLLDLYSAGGDVVITIDKRLTATKTTGDGTVYMPVFYPLNTSEVIFTVMNAFYVLLGGTDTTWSGVNIGVDAGKVVDFTPTGLVIKRDLIAGITLKAVTGSVVKVVSNGAGLFSIYIKSGNAFVLQQTINKTDVPTVVGINANTRLGHCKFVETEPTEGILSNLWLNSNTLDYNAGINSSSPSRWANKEWDPMGDSITNWALYQPVVQTRLGLASWHQYGVGGSCLASNDAGDNGSFAYRVGTMSNTANIVSVFGGTNDYGLIPPKPLGVLGDTVNTTIYGAIDSIIKTIIANIPNAKLFFITPVQRNYTGVDGATLVGWGVANALGYKLIDVVNAIQQVCAIYGVPVLDLYRNSGITDLNKALTLRDGLHPSDTGFVTIGHQIASFMDTL